MLQDLHKEFKTFWHTMRSWLYIYMFLAFGLFSVGIKEYTLFGYSGYFFGVGGESFAALVFQRIVTDVAPATVPLIVTSPLTAFVVQIKLALLLALVLTIPLLIHSLISFIAPALYRKERLTLFWVMVASTGLFFAGGIFSYVFIIPITLTVLYEFSVPIGVTAMLSSDILLSMVVSLVFVTGIAFMLPVMMVLLTWVGAVAPRVWGQYWRQVFIAFLIVSAIITPDGSGVSMFLLTVPTTMLYGCGVFISSLVVRPQTVSKVSEV